MGGEINHTARYPMLPAVQAAGVPDGSAVLTTLPIYPSPDCGTVWATAIARGTTVRVDAASGAAVPE